MAKTKAIGDRKYDLFGGDKAKKKAPPKRSDRDYPKAMQVNLTLYKSDLDFLEDTLHKLKISGYRTASKSKIIRFALSRILELPIEEYILK